MKIAKGINRLGTEAVYNIFAETQKLAKQGKKVIDLSLGQSDFKSPQNVVDATIKALKDKYTFCFYPRHGYKPIMKAYTVKNKFIIKKKDSILSITAFDVVHGLIKATGFVFNKIAYISDCNKIPKNSFNHLLNLDYLIIDCLRIDKHPSHFNYSDALALINKVKPKKTILTNLHVDLDYRELKKKLSQNILPAYDGMNFNF